MGLGLRCCPAKVVDRRSAVVGALCAMWLSGPTAHSDGTAASDDPTNRIVYRARDHSAAGALPSCYAKIYTRPVRNEEAKQTPPTVP